MRLHGQTGLPVATIYILAVAAVPKVLTVCAVRTILGFPQRRAPLTSTAISAVVAVEHGSRE